MDRRSFVLVNPGCRPCLQGRQGGARCLVGTFCIWACMKSYNQRSGSHLSSVRSTLITHFYRKCCDAKLPGLGTSPAECRRLLQPAPPRSALAAFGGWMTMDEFRGCEKVYTVIPRNVTMLPPVIEEVPARSRKPVKLVQDEVSYEHVTAHNEMVRASGGLKRKKPLAKHNLLMKTLGLECVGTGASGSCT